MEGVIGKLHGALVVDQRNSINHRIKGPSPSFAHAPNPISEVVDGNQISLLDVTACPGNPKLDLGQLTVREVPMGFEGSFSGFPDHAKRCLQLLCGWRFQEMNQGGRGQPRERSAEVGFCRRIGVAQAEIPVEAEKRCRRRGEELSKPAFTGDERTPLCGEAFRHVAEGPREISNLGRWAPLQELRRPIRVKGTHPVGKLIEGRHNPANEDQSHHQRQNQSECEAGKETGSGSGQVGTNPRPRDQQYDVD